MPHEHHDHDHDVLGYIDGAPVPVALLDERVTRLREGPRAAALPTPGTSEDRQLRRWVAQVILTERLCAADFDGDDVGLARLDAQAAVELGSINAAAFEGHPAVRAAYERVTGEVEGPEEQVEAFLAATAHRPAPPSADDAREHVRAAARRRHFVIWLDRQREARVRLVHGLEHPGDPSQPDNHHTH
ncbi:DUF7158 domain-containing protein [Phytomonospora endophytica]|uniref:[acyl-carrier-protein] S-malonyltransferase n=1 Tax=Phytomonospora endophytica TaxID=714109 RepID=A0A841FNX2_9ACTN|nr:hypothetical protein [Phytomonospora endophytica]MBB6037524.1 [acyl-carrier-protein] S-malonyltransferase [Phytomonospora endophytica]